ncbi:hypothetical protein [Dyella ginsengisoli]|uniref:hypothetical protein n=1 Tax=Dyella ginsengisoli TaxID=363848 RepID=UPI00037F023B|nr:hypothetical protein [Dyella ginsengisoli]
MMHTRAELEAELAALEQMVVQLLAEQEAPADFWDTFAEEADHFASRVAPADWDWADERLADMLRRHGAPVRGASRATLQKHLDQLDALMPDMVRGSPTYELFAEAYLPREIYILDQAGEANGEWARERLREMLLKHGAMEFD